MASVTNKSLYHDAAENALRRSAVQAFEGPLLFKGLAAKFVLSGTEHYYVQGQHYSVQTGCYILGNSHTPSEGSIKSQQAVQGLCVDISTSIIQEILNEHWEETKAFQAFLTGEEFLVNQYTATHTQLGRQLVQIEQQLQQHRAAAPSINLELFYQLAEALISDQYQLFRQRQQLPFKKSETKNTLLRQLLEVKQQLERQPLQRLSLEEMAAQACVSKYRFVRLFKAAFGSTPYRFQRQQQLKVAQVLLQQGQSVQQVAFAVGFNDAVVFNKAFKAVYGLPPSQIIK